MDCALRARTAIYWATQTGFYSLSSPKRFCWHSDVWFYVKRQSSPTTHLWRRRGRGRYSSYSFTTSAVDGGEWSASRPGRALPPGKRPPVPIVQEAGWVPEPVWTQRIEEKFSYLGRGSNLDSPVVQVVVRHYTGWVTPACFGFMYFIFIALFCKFFFVYGRTLLEKSEQISHINVHI
jgi:hypothetical protein